jgi:hypothetical protein
MSYLRPNKRSGIKWWSFVIVLIVTALSFIAAPLLHHVVVFALIPLAKARDAVVSTVLPWYRGPGHSDLTRQLMEVQTALIEAQTLLSEQSIKANISEQGGENATSSLFGFNGVYSATGTEQVVVPDLSRSGVVGAKEQSNKDEQFANAGPVIIRPPFSPYDEIVVAAKLAIASGTEAFVRVRGQYIPVGTFVESSGPYAHAYLFSHTKTEQLIEFGTSTTQFKAIGYGGGVFSVEVPKGIPLSKGTVVRRSADRAQIFSIVDDIDDDPAKPTRVVYFALPVSLFLVDTVYVRK